MEYLIGIGLALGVSLFARFVGLDRDRSFYPTVMIVIASLYGLFAILGGSMPVLGLELVIGAGFILTAILGFKRNLWFVVAALAAHGVYDFFHHHAFANPGVPVWYPGFCLMYDVTAAGWLAWWLRRKQLTVPKEILSQLASTGVHQEHSNNEAITSRA
jgi:hypothetical protein